MAEMFYIGPMNSGTNDFYTMYRANGSSRNRLRGNQQGGGGNNLTDINSLFNNKDPYYITFVFGAHGPKEF